MTEGQILFYETADGRRDRPAGYGAAATFHYLTQKRLAELLRVYPISDDVVWNHVHHLISAGATERAGGLAHGAARAAAPAATGGGGRSQVRAAYL